MLLLAFCGAQHQLAAEAPMQDAALLAHDAHGVASQRVDKARLQRMPIAPVSNVSMACQC
jgi:hypothetical protein